jgi:hypothetical protein
MIKIVIATKLKENVDLPCLYAVTHSTNVCEKSCLLLKNLLPNKELDLTNSASLSPISKDFMATA